MLGAEDLHDLSLNGHAVLTGVIFNKLLGDGRTTELAVAAHKHIDAGLHGGDPVHTLMLVEALIFDGDGSIDQILGNLIQRCPLTIHGSIEPLQQNDVAVGIQTIDKRSLIKVCDIQLIILGLQKYLILQIIAQNTHEDKSAYQHDQHHGCQRTQGDLKRRKQRHPYRIQQFQAPVRVPLLLRDLPLSFPSVILIHIIYLHDSGSARTRMVKNPTCGAYEHSTSHNIIAQLPRKRKT